ncbi:MAG: hypothetical protein R2813_08560 [Flavobacteriales bacterium]
MDACFDADGCPEGIACKYGRCECPDSLFGLTCQFEYPENVEGEYMGDADCDSWIGNTISFCNVNQTSNPLIYRVNDFAYGTYEIEFTTNTHFIVKQQTTGGTIGYEVSGEGEFRNGEFDYTLDIKSDYGGFDEEMTCDFHLE